MKQLRFLTVLAGLLVAALVWQAGAAEIKKEAVDAAFPKKIPAHPRLLLTDARLAEVKQTILTDTTWQGVHEAMIDGADRLLGAKPLERKLEGRRLLGVSRECLRREMLLSYAWRMTGEAKYLTRAEVELRAVSDFSDWNPSHFLDVAEMTAAVAIGYDWLYAGLTDESKKVVAGAIATKGLKPSFDIRYNSWLRGNNNWNQVCNAGMTLGALALWESNEPQAREVVLRAVNSVQLPMALYEPDGDYPEGPGYWVYGTSFNVMLLSAMQAALGTDFGLSAQPGFARSAQYIIHVAGPTGRYFNYPDSGSGIGFNPAVFWYAQHYNDPTLASQELRGVARMLEARPRDLSNDRLAPLALAWAGGISTDAAQAPQALSFLGRGKSAVAMFRTGWESDATWLAIKGGSPGVNHGHMDVGTFVLDADGQRWAADLGPEDYNKIEQLGMTLWSNAQNSQRWTIFRYNNLSHNTLVVNDQHQQVGGKAPIIRYDSGKPFGHAVIDMTPVYQGQLASAIRGAALLPSGQVLIQDEIKATEEPATVRWAMVTPAAVEIQSDRVALLTQKGKTMRFEVTGGPEVKLAIYSTEPKADYDARNPNTRMIGFELKLAADQQTTVQVWMTPGSAKDTKPAVPASVLDWSGPLAKGN